MGWAIRGYILLYGLGDPRLEPILWVRRSEVTAYSMGWAIRGYSLLYGLGDSRLEPILWVGRSEVTAYSMGWAIRGYSLLYGLGDPRLEPRKSKKYSLLQKAQIFSKAHPPSYSVDTRGSFPEDEASGA
jgi:hypothetical protein